MKKNALSLLVIILLSFIAFIPEMRTANADTGPKPFVEISFTNLPEGELYATLLSKNKSTGPFSYDYSHYEEDDGIDAKFSSYSDKDGYYYLHFYNRIDISGKFVWRYYPPADFKILIYSETEKKFIEHDEALTRYAFSSYFGYDASTGKVKNNYDYFGETLKLLLRIALTIGIEIGIALLFKYRGKELTLIIITNVITQIGLNVALNAINYRNGALALSLLYIAIELIIVIAEAVTYAIGIRIIEKKQNEKPRNALIHVAYAFAANLTSFVAGAGFLLLIGV